MLAAKAEYKSCGKLQQQSCAAFSHSLVANDSTVNVHNRCSIVVITKQGLSVRFCFHSLTLMQTDL